MSKRSRNQDAGSGRVTRVPGAVGITTGGDTTPAEPRLRSIEPDASLRGTIFNYMNTVIGSGTLALPYNFFLDGAVVGVVVICLVAFLAEQTASMLLYVTDATSGRSYGEIGTRVTNSRIGGMVIDATVALLTFGIMTSYVVLVGDLVPEVLHDLGADGWATERHFVCAVVSAVVFFPLTCLSDLKFLGVTSFLSIACVSSFVIVIVVESISKLASPDEARFEVPPGETDFRLIGVSGMDFLTTVPVMFFAYIAHQNIPLLYRELRHKTRSAQTRASEAKASSAHARLRQQHPGLVPLTPSTPALPEVMSHGGVLPADKVSKWTHKREKMMTAIRFSLVGCTMVYVATALSGYNLFRGGVNPDVLLNFTVSRFPFMPYIKAAYCLVLVFSFPVMSFGCRESVHQILFGGDARVVETATEPLLPVAARSDSTSARPLTYGGAPSTSSLPPSLKLSLREELGRAVWMRFVEALVLVACAAVLGLSVPNIQVVFEFTGATCAVNVMYTFPAGLYLIARRKEDSAGAGPRQGWTRYVPARGKHNKRLLA